MTLDPEMKDVAAGADDRGVTVQEVGVTDVHVPILLRRKAGGRLNVVARATFGVELPHHFRGTHMSRLVDILFQWREKPIGPHDLEVMLAEACARLEAPRARISLDFKYFITKQAPVSGCPSALDYDCRFVSETAPQGNVFTLGVEVPVTCLCPCSREISERGAHNQRAIIRVRLRSVGNEIIWIEDLVQRLEAHGSSPIYPLLKREDEKFVTEWAYDHPKFVEDVLRDVVVDLRADPHLAWFRVECESHESIHHHSVYARQEESRAPSGAFERPGEE